MPVSANEEQPVNTDKKKQEQVTMDIAVSVIIALAVDMLLSLKSYTHDPVRHITYKAAIFAAVYIILALKPVKDFKQKLKDRLRKKKEIV